LKKPLQLKRKSRNWKEKSEQNLKYASINIFRKGKQMELNFLGKHFKIDGRHYFILLLIFLLGLGMRAYLMKYELIFEFDTYWHARITSYLIQAGTVPLRDPMAYYQLGGSTVGWLAPLFWILSAGIYKAFTFWLPYSKDLWFVFVKFLPAFYGALIALAAYLVGNEAFDRKTGYLMGFFVATASAFIYRTMAGQFEEDSLGFLWMLLGFYFLIKALKVRQLNKQMIFNSVIAGVFFAGMAYTWEMYLLILMIVVPFAVFNVIRDFVKEEKFDLKASLFPFIGSLATFIVLIFPYNGLAWLKAFAYVQSALPNINPLFLVAGLIGLGIALYVIYLMIQSKSTEAKDTKRVWNYLLMAFFYLLLIGFFVAMLNYQQAKLGVLGVTVGEESLGNQFFGHKYMQMIIAPLVALALIPLMVFKSRKNHYDYLFFFWIMVTFFMAWSKLKFSYVFGLAVGVSAAIVVYYAFKFMQARPTLEKKILGLALGFLLVSSVASGALFVSLNTPNIEYGTGWKESLYWLRDNTPKDAKIFNWWDEGHWISTIGERAVSSDNRNWDGQANQDFALLLLSTDLNEGLNLLEQYKPDYLMFGDDLLQKQGSLGLYAYQITDFSDPRLRIYFGVGAPCNKNVDGLTKKATFECGGNRIPEEQMNLLPVNWTNIPIEIKDGTMPLFAYRAPDNSRMYIINSATNNSVLAKIWFHEPNAAAHFEEVYNNTEVKIFKVIS